MKMTSLKIVTNGLIGIPKWFHPPASAVRWRAIIHGKAKPSHICTVMR